MPYKRETAHRVTSKEFRAITVKLESEGEKTPNHLLSPLGALVNRVHVVGVCTEVEPVGDGGTYRARVSDPLGVFTLYAGQYQPEAALALSELEPPCFVAVTGKAKTWGPEPGKLFVSISPESVHVVDEETRDHYVLDAVKCTLERLKAVEAFIGGAKTVDALRGAGVRETVAEGVLLAAEHYGVPSVDGYRDSLRACLTGLLPGGVFETHMVDAGRNDEVTPAPAWTPPQAKKIEEASPVDEAFDEAVLGIVQGGGEEGVSWDNIVSYVKESIDGTSEENVETSLNRLMDKGLCYEPVLGTIKAT